MASSTTGCGFQLRMTSGGDQSQTFSAVAGTGTLDDLSATLVAALAHALGRDPAEADWVGGCWTRLLLIAAHPSAS